MAHDVKSSPTGMRLDHPLSVHGVQQAAHLGAFLSDPARTAPYPVPERVFSSPFYRCLQTAQPTAALLAERANEPRRIALDHGVMEWYPPAKKGTGLHPRPSGPATLEKFFPEALDLDYLPSVYPDRKGEKMQALFDRIDLFVDVFTARMDATPVRTVVIFEHAATVIALGQALTGDRKAEACAGCACTSLYRRRTDKGPGGGSVGAWEQLWNGRADYMPGGVERDWAVSGGGTTTVRVVWWCTDALLQFHQVALAGGEVVEDEGDLLEHSPEDELPVGLVKGMDKYLPPSRRQDGSKAATSRF